MQNSLRVVLFLLALYAALVFKAQAQDVFNPVAQGRRGFTASGGFQYNSGTNSNFFAPSSYQSYENQVLGGDLGLGFVKFIAEGKRLDIGLNATSTFSRNLSTFVSSLPPPPSSTTTFLQNNSTFGPYIRLVKYVKVFDLNRWYFTYGARFGLGFGTANLSTGSNFSSNTTKSSSWNVNANATALLGLAFFPSERIGLDAFVNLVTLSYVYQSTIIKQEGSATIELPETKSSSFNANLFSGFSTGAVGVSFTYYLK